jgi:EAL domain-containing protein (putative c-di-GMP-specific phosphodiesterase class I)
VKANLDIIPIHVFANSANKAEMLNGQLRAQGLAVKPLWRNSVDDDEGLDPELVFFFDDTEKPGLDEVADYAERHHAPLLVVASQYDAKSVDEALSAGAQDWLLADQDALIAAATRRARRHARHTERIRQLEDARVRDRELIEQNFSSSQEAIAVLSEGIFLEANEVCAKRFGFDDPHAMAGQPVMDLFAAESQGAIKKALKQLSKKGVEQKLDDLKINQPDQEDGEISLRLEPFSKDGETCVRMRIAGEKSDNKLLGRIKSLEEENARLSQLADSAERNASATHLLSPADFGPLAAQALGRIQTSARSAVVLIRPTKLEETRKRFGIVGTAELGGHLCEALADCLEEDDLATPAADLSLIALITRKSDAALESWLASTLKSMGARVFEGGEHSGHLGFSAGYTLVNRIRQLEPLIQQAEQVATSEAGTFGKHEQDAGVTDVDDDSWEALIREALEERRYTLLLEPIENLASGARQHVAHPCLVDRDGKPIKPESFRPPAERLGLLPVLEHRFVGNALRALLTHRQGETSAGIIVPLHHNSLTDKKLLEFLGDLIQRAEEKPDSGAFTLEFDVNDIADRVRETEKFIERVKSLGCSTGLREYAPTPGSDKLASHLRIESLRTAENLMAQLEEDSEFDQTFRQSMEHFQQHDIDVIATGANDSSAMAHLYNLGITMVQGPIIGEAELFKLSEPNQS